MANCIFCKIVNGDIPSKKIYEDELVLAFFDIDPKAPVHAVLIPKTHVSNILEMATLSDELLAHLLRTVGVVAKKLGIDENGFRIVSNCGEHGAQSVQHFHIHILGGRQLGVDMG